MGSEEVHFPMRGKTSPSWQIHRPSLFRTGVCPGRNCRDQCIHDSFPGVFCRNFVSPALIWYVYALYLIVFIQCPKQLRPPMRSAISCSGLCISPLQPSAASVCGRALATLGSWGGRMAKQLGSMHLGSMHLGESNNHRHLRCFSRFRQSRPSFTNSG